MLYPLSYTGTIPVAGFEPATTRLTGEVTLVFTTGRNFLLRTHVRVCGGMAFALPSVRLQHFADRCVRAIYFLAREQEVTEGLAP